MQQGLHGDSGHLGELCTSKQVLSDPDTWRRMSTEQQLCLQIRALKCICTDPQLKIKLGKYKRN